MRHHKKIRKFSRVRKVRSALMKSLARSLIVHGRITTTEAKAKELRPYAERLITKGKSGTIASRKLVAAEFNSAAVAKKVFEVLAPKYKDTNGGYTRIIKLPARKTDSAKQAIIEFV